MVTHRQPPLRPLERGLILCPSLILIRWTLLKEIPFLEKYEAAYIFPDKYKHLLLFSLCFSVLYGAAPIAAHAVQPLEQPAFRVVGVGLEHLPLQAEHREHAPLGVVGELEALTPVRLGIVLVGPDQPHHLAVAVVDGALHPAVPLDAPDLPVEQIVRILLSDGDVGHGPGRPVRVVDIGRYYLFHGY